MGNCQPQAALNGVFFLNGGQSSSALNRTEVSPTHQLTEPGTTCISVYFFIWWLNPAPPQVRGSSHQVIKRQLKSHVKIAMMDFDTTLLIKTQFEQPGSFLCHLMFT